MSDVEELKEALRKKRPKSVIKMENLLGSPSTLLNLICTNRSKGCIPKGHYLHYVGKSGSAKTWIAIAFLAEASINPKFEDYRLIYDAPEDGALMDISHYFGQRLSDKIEPPSHYEDGSPRFSSTVEEFYDNIDNASRKGNPFIYLLDSMDAISSAAEEKKYKKQKKAREDNTKSAGSYGDNKAKINSQNLRRALVHLKKTGSILIIISQTRDALGFGFDPDTYSGGHALKFYATIQLWSSVKQKIKKTVKGKPRQIGIIARVKVKKNRITGKERFVDIPILNGAGIDDIGSCLDFLVQEGHWKKGCAPEFNYKGSRDGLIKHIEDEELEKELRGIVTNVWNEIEQACTSFRKRKYDE